MKKLEPFYPFIQTIVAMAISLYIAVAEIRVDLKSVKEDMVRIEKSVKEDVDRLEDNIKKILNDFYVPVTRINEK